MEKQVKNSQAGCFLLTLSFFRLETAFQTKYEDLVVNQKQ